MKDSGFNGSTHSLNLNFNTLQRTDQLFPCCDSPFILLMKHEYVFTVFNSKPISLLATNKASMFFIVCMHLLSQWTSSAQTRSWCVPFNFNPSWFVWTFQTAYSKTRSKSNNEKVHLSSKSNNEKVHPSPSFRSFLIENVSDKYLSIGDLHYVSVQHIFH